MINFIGLSLVLSPSRLWKCVELTERKHLEEAQLVFNAKFAGLVRSKISKISLMFEKLNDKMKNGKLK